MRLTAPSLDLLWTAFAAVGVAVLAMLAAMILVRLFSPFQEARREARRLRLVGLFLKPAPTPAEEAAVRRAPAALVASVCIELLEMVRGGQKRAICAAGGRYGVPERLRRQLRMRSWGKRLAAAEALANFDGDENAAALATALDDRWPAVRLAAAISLASNGRAPPLDELVAKLGLGTEESSRFILRLFKEGAARDPQEVEALLDNDAVPPAVKTDAADALAAQGGYESVDAIAALVLDADAPEEVDTVPGLVRILGDLAHPSAAEAVSHALDSDLWQVRAAAAEAAGKIRLSDRVDRLSDLVGDGHWLVRFQASEALIRLGDAGDVALRRLAGTTRGPQREAAQIALGRQPA